MPFITTIHNRVSRVVGDDRPANRGRDGGRPHAPAQDFSPIETVAMPTERDPDVQPPPVAGDPPAPSVKEPSAPTKEEVAWDAYWGRVSGGNASGIVRELTRRLRGAGNAALGFDNFLGELEDLSAGYTGRFGPWVVGAIVDEDGNLDLGAAFQRPAGARDWRLALRAAEGTFGSRGGQRFDTKGLSLVGEVIYGSTTLDAGAGYERLSSRGPDLDRRYVSAGMRTKAGVLSLSLEGHVGRIEGKDEASVALGGQYDIAQGLSANLGLNHAKARMSFDGVPLLDIEETKTVLSLRYSF